MNMEQIRAAFASFDLNNDGQITCEGEPKILKHSNHFLFLEWGGQGWNIIFIINLFFFKLKFCFIFIVFLEYVKACRLNGNASSESTLREAFKLFDLDNDGSIDFNEFASAMKFLSGANK